MRSNTPIPFCLLAEPLSTALLSPKQNSSAMTTLPDGATRALPAAASTDAVTASDQLDQLVNFAHDEMSASLADGTSKQKRRRTYTLLTSVQGTFLAWHRYFIWHYEQALRNGETTATGLVNYPIFDGSVISMSGDGEFIPGQGNIILGGDDLPEILIPAGSGDGCVTLGLVSLCLTNSCTITNRDGLSYNPRCLKRELTDYVNRRFANTSSTVNLILKPKEIYDFQMTMQGYPGSGDIGVQGGGHYTIGGDLGRDLFVSPGDPPFYLHHGMIGRVWWSWELFNRTTRTGTEGIFGTGTFLNVPPSQNITLDNPMDLGFGLGPSTTMKDLMSTTNGPFCHIHLCKRISWNVNKCLICVT
ncbi:Di-copper centre-containing protein [Lindgomyces ingoldianus]|uniref:Di-copper centre-containing protein n=1 Tax=Lindgomyces ingoldianus TaxID=673940 RepID=A0ACB6RB03_9PLEO|nr:Di-copper centre-containing protein [Lindgomyces ingoldianus]KAF2476494.1 Di-copper centre-containing protein [Lindgomyces ingoldianus]